MFTMNTLVSGTKMAIGEAGIAAVLGYAVVFFGLLLLMLVVIAIGKIMVSRDKKAAAVAEAAKAAVPAAEPAPAPAKEKATGTAGEFLLNDVSERDAAMVMAIVADKMGKPLNEIRFKSIREVK